MLGLFEEDTALYTEYVTGLQAVCQRVMDCEVRKKQIRLEGLCGGSRQVTLYCALWSCEEEESGSDFSDRKSLLHAAHLRAMPLFLRLDLDSVYRHNY